MAKKEKIEPEVIEEVSEIITDITKEYFSDSNGNPKVKKTYWNKDIKIKEEVVND